MLPWISETTAIRISFLSMVISRWIQYSMAALSRLIAGIAFGGAATSIKKLLS